MAHRLHNDELPQPGAGHPAAAPFAAKTRSYYQTMSASSVGIELAVAVIFGLLFGRWLDGQIGTTPWMMILWLLIGCVAGLRAILRFAARDARINDAKDPPAPPTTPTPGAN